MNDRIDEEIDLGGLYGDEDDEPGTQAQNHQLPASNAGANGVPN